MGSKSSMQSGGHVLAIDLGSSGVKVGLVSGKGHLIAHADRDYPTRFLPDGGVEQEPQAWWRALCEGVRSVLQQGQLPAEEILAVACTGQWSVTVPVDAEGEALMPAVHWLDQRGAPYNRRITKGVPSIQGYGVAKLLQWLRLVGAPPTHSGQDALGHILFIKHERPEVYAQTHTFLEPMDYINMRLTGRHCATQNSVTATLLVDNRSLDSLDYNGWLLRASGVDRDKLPDLVPAHTILGSLTEQAAQELGLTTKTVVVTGSTDNASSAIGAGAIADFEPVAVLGTSGYLALHVPFKKTDLLHMIGSMPSVLPDRYLLISDMGNTGRVLDSFLSNLVYAQDPFSDAPQPQDRYMRLERAASEVPAGSGGVLFLPWFNGSLAPSEDPHMRGGFLNLSSETTRGMLARAVLEGIAFNWRWLREVSERLIGQPFTSWRLTGGGALSPLWSQIMADVVGIPMRQQREPRYTNVLGAGFLGFHALGRIDLAALPEIVQPGKAFTPSHIRGSTYDELYRQFRRSFKRTQSIHHALQGL
jgi:xylulokinase